MHSHIQPSQFAVGARLSTLCSLRLLGISLLGLLLRSRADK